MSTSAEGVIRDKAGNGLDKLTVILHDVSALFDSQLGTVETQGGGRFSLTYSPDLFPQTGVRKFRLRIRVGRHVIKELKLDDVTADVLHLQDIEIDAAEATSVLATLGTGAPSRYTTNNAVAWRVDNVDAWGHAAKLLRNATRNIGVMALNFDIDKFHASVSEEKPQVVLDFDPPIDSDSLRKVSTDTSKDGRIERLLFDAASRPGMVIRIQLPTPVVDWGSIPHAVLLLLEDSLALAVAAGAVIGTKVSQVFGDSAVERIIGGVSGVLAGTVVGAIVLAFGIPILLWLGAKGDRNYLANQIGDWTRLRDWVKDAGLANVHVKPFHQKLFSVTHTKMVVVEGEEALLLGSPYHQGYFDSQLHAVDQPERGSVSQSAPIHDVSVSVRGPAVRDLEQVFNAHWNLADPSTPEPEPPPPPGPVGVLAPEEMMASVQVVNSFNKAMLKSAPTGEKGILEAYLRAIHFAERFIYCENQYFTTDEIRDAFIDALNAKPDLRVILALNVTPDTPHYFRWQKNAIKTVLESIGPNADKRFGVFTLWSYAEPVANHKPRLVKNYIHAKAALIDNTWGTVGAANLENPSLTQFDWLFRLEVGDYINTETNCIVYEQGLSPNPTVDRLRRILWSEHLGLAVNDPALADSPGKDWLDVWLQRAEQKRLALINTPSTESDPRVLRWPVDARRDTSQDYLKRLGIDRNLFDLGAPRSFDFSTGTWKK